MKGKKVSIALLAASLRNAYLYSLEQAINIALEHKKIELYISVLERSDLYNYDYAQKINVLKRFNSKELWKQFAEATAEINWRYLHKIPIEEALDLARQTVSFAPEFAVIILDRPDISIEQANSIMKR